MAQFPVSDQQGIIDGLNYVLSGPVSQGQNFAGFTSSSYQWDLTGNYRPPFTQENINAFGIPNVNLYVAPITISTVEFLDVRTLKVTFSAAQATAPFALGQGFGLTATGITPSTYDDLITNDAYRIGVVECTTTYVIVRLSEDNTILANGTGGTISLDSMNLDLSTDCNAKVIVSSPLDTVVLAGQLSNYIITDPAYPGSVYYTVSINRYKASPTFDATNPDYRFNLDAIVAYKTYLISTVSSPNFEQDTIFTSIIDRPGENIPNYKGGYYWYIMEVKFVDNAGGVIVTNNLLTLRSFSAQVIKQ
jgi:hypothetical protein